MPAYSGVKIIADAITGAKSTDPEKVAAYIHANSFKTPIGNVAIRQEGRPEGVQVRRLHVAQGRHQDRRQVILRSRWRDCLTWRQPCEMPHCGTNGAFPHLVPLHE
jgi:hypothetical protein